MEGDHVIVVMDANKTKGGKDALEWALKYAVRPRDTVLVLGVLYEHGSMKNYCFPFLMGIGSSGIWERSELTGQKEVNCKETEEEIKEKRGEYESSLQQFYRQCRKIEVELEVRISAGFCTRDLVVQEAKKCSARWIILDSQWKKDKVYIWGHVSCNVAVTKGKDSATLIKARETQPEFETEHPIPFDEGESSSPPPPPQIPCWFPLSWRPGFPRAFAYEEIEVITNGFADENILLDENEARVYQGIFQETPALITCFLESDEHFWSVLKMLSRIRHRNIVSLVGYCCTNSSRFMLFDYPCMKTLEQSLQCDEFRRKAVWRTRWCIALEIGGSLRYLHEECTDGPIVHLAVSSANIVFSHGCSAMLTSKNWLQMRFKLGNFGNAKWLELKDDLHRRENLPAESHDLEVEKLLSVDIHDYGIFLVELITGKSARTLADQEIDSITDWAVPRLEDGLGGELMDPRLIEVSESDTEVVHHMARAALQCLKSGEGQRVCMSKVLAIVRGNQLAMS